MTHYIIQMTRELLCFEGKAFKMYSKEKHELQYEISNKISYLQDIKQTNNTFTN